ncbi:MAG TPA: polyribonucleotide nucleotidyltransferase [Armatimonadota bacterium]|nr:polyribonucleotide nucleotidyltransferase [Armatimonadota bacterium]
MQSVQCTLNGKVLSIETGRMAKQADGSVLVRCGDTVILAAVTMANTPREGIDFFPLTVDFEERMYSAGKIPGGFIKREGRPSERAILSARMTDRPIRPLFPKHFRNEVQIIITVLATDQENQPDILGSIGASAALSISRIPFQGPVGAVRVGRVDGEFVLNPTFQQVEAGDLDLVVAGTREGVIMMEAGAQEIPEDVMVAAIEFGEAGIRAMIELQDELVGLINPEKVVVPEPEVDEELMAAVKAFAPRIRATIVNPEKQARESATADLIREIEGELIERFPERLLDIRGYLGQVIKYTLRQLILDEGRRPDGRQPDEIRPITIEAGVLPRVHGSGLFTRGQTQALTVLTLGGMGEGQILDTISPEEEKRYMHQYNFPPYSVGEVRPMRGPGRREIGHGALAERALLPVLPDVETFPYTLRLVSEVLESNGSSSMASTCGSTLALMDAGVPITAPVAGIAMGMVSDETRAVLLTDIQGVEDGSGDMDFKVTGTRAGITGIQMDVKRGGLSRALLAEAFQRARNARLHIIEKIEDVIPAPRADLAATAPRVVVIEIHPDKIGDVIGPGGKVVKKIQGDLGVKVDIEQDGRVFIAAPDLDTAMAARKIIDDITRDIAEGEVYVGKVVDIKAGVGAIVEIAPGRDGMIHISQLAHERVARVEDVVNIGDEVVVKVIERDPSGKIRLSRKGLLPTPEPGTEGYVPPRPDGDRGPRHGDRGPRRDRGDRGGDRGGDNRPRRRF